MHVSMSIVMTNNVSANELIGQTLYMLDLDGYPSFNILNNSVRTNSGEITIEIDQEFSPLWISYIGKNVIIVGDKSRIYFNLKRNVLKDEFKGGTVYVTSNENSNLGKTYEIYSNTETYLTLTSQIIPAATTTTLTAETEQLNDVINGQSISIVGINGAELTVTCNRNVINNEFSGFTADLFNDAFVSVAQAVPVYSNSENKLIVGNASTFIGKESPVSSFRLNGISFSPLPSFNNRTTTTEEDLYHNTNMVGGIVSGFIDYFSDIGASTVSIVVNNTTGFLSAIVQQQGDLFNGAIIRFSNPYNLSAEYFAEVVSHDSISITVKILPTTQWDYNNYSETKISQYWKWQIDATNYGYTIDTIYDDFTVLTQSVTQDVLAEQDAVFVSDTSQMIVGDKIKLINSKNISEINYIETIVSINEIKLTLPTQNEYLVSDSSSIKVLRNSFTNTHEHQIRNNMLSTLYIQDYTSRGYFLRHSHRSIALIDNVSSIIKDSSKIVVGGNGSFLYETSDNCASWKEMVDLNNYLEGGSEVTGVSTLSIYNGNIIAGTTNGNIFTENIQGDSIVPLIQPEISI